MRLAGKSRKQRKKWNEIDHFDKNWMQTYQKIKDSNDRMRAAAKNAKTRTKNKDTEDVDRLKLQNENLKLQLQLQAIETKMSLQHKMHIRKEELNTKDLDEFDQIKSQFKQNNNNNCNDSNNWSENPKLYTEIGSFLVSEIPDLERGSDSDVNGNKTNENRTQENDKSNVIAALLENDVANMTQEQREELRKQLNQILDNSVNKDESKIDVKQEKRTKVSENQKKKRNKTKTKKPSNAITINLLSDSDNDSSGNNHNSNHNNNNSNKNVSENDRINANQKKTGNCNLNSTKMDNINDNVNINFSDSNSKKRQQNETALEKALQKTPEFSFNDTNDKQT